MIVNKPTRKKIAKLLKKKTRKANEYYEFTKYYSNRLSSEHPRWSTNQITTIVKLLWRKRKVSKARSGGKVPKITKQISGFIAYKRFKLSEGMTRENIVALWKRLPK